jgi:ABC-type uncharacterized transport system fused permease/ATPase subunit
LLDESFAGLDKESVFKIQSLIKKHLEPSIIISIDHEWRSNNGKGFYTDTVELQNPNEQKHEFLMPAINNHRSSHR